MRKRDITKRTVNITMKTPLTQNGRAYRFDVYQGKEYFRCWKKSYYSFLEVGKTVTLLTYTNKFGTMIDSIEGVPTEKKFDVDIEESIPANKMERGLYETLSRQGWDITRRGWPDFACFRNGEFMVVEVKAKKDRQLRKRQLQVMKELANHGIKTYFYYGETNVLSEVSRDISL